jgi:hypothetical protein
VVLSGSLPVRAQGTRPDPAALCFHPGPASACRTFILFEARGQSPFVQPYRRIRFEDGGEVLSTVPVKELSQSFGWDVGLAVNVAQAWAVGATVGYEFAEASRRRTAALRLRRWITDDVALELAPGVFQLHETDTDGPDRWGGNAALRLALWDKLVLAVRYDALSVDSSERVLDDGSRRIDPGGLEEDWSAGLGLESMTGVVASTVGFLVLGVALGGAIGAGG